MTSQQFDYVHNTYIVSNVLPLGAFLRITRKFVNFLKDFFGFSISLKYNIKNINIMWLPAQNTTFMCSCLHSALNVLTL